MLALEVDYLAGQVHAADYRDRDRAEWPPHPARLFSALLAASCEAGFGEAGREVLRWLERQAPPALGFSETVARRSVLTHYVPVNDPAGDLGLLPAFRLRQPRTFPCAVPADSRVRFVWPAAEPDLVQRALLDELAGAVTYLGSARSLVRVRVIDDPGEITLVPDERGDTVLRVVGPGRMDELDELYGLGRRPTPGRLQHYASPSPAACRNTPPLEEMLIFRIVRHAAEPVPSLGQTLAFTQRLRNAVLALAGDHAPAALHGHGPGQHCAWVPLPFVGHEHADGRLLGVALLLPRELAPGERRAILKPLAGLRTVRLGHERYLTVEYAPDDRRETLQAHTWTRRARHWCTVTPMLLDRFPRPGKPGRELRDLILRACRHMELPTPEAIVVDRGPMLPGVPPSGAFQVRRRPGERPRPYTHVSLRFAEKVAGPLLLGAGRYFGLGLFRPVPETGEMRHAS